MAKLPLIVTAMLLEYRGSVLAAERRNPPGLAGKWELPGGKLDPGESPQDCLVREIKEELGLDITVLEAFDISFYEYPDTGPVLILCYKCRFKGEPKTGISVGLEGQGVKWVEASRLLELAWVPTDLPIIKRHIAGMS